jgi:hypothetical protein
VKLFHTALLAALSLPTLAQANDSTAGVSAGGIVLRKTDAIAMKKEVLSVSRQVIKVDYEFLNETDADVDETIAFPLPAYPATNRQWQTYYGQPPGFVINVDGKPVKFTTRLEAVLGKRNVTEQLRQAGLSDAQIAYNPGFHMVKEVPLTPAQKTRLGKLGLYGDQDGEPDSRLWSVEVNYVWSQKFPAHKVVKVHHAYSPFVDNGPGVSDLKPDFEKRYCADKGFLNAWHHVAKKNKTDSVTAEYVSYILKSGNNWKNGIEDFTLNVIKQDPVELVSLCFPGKFTKVDATTYQVHLTNFHPKEDLAIYFGNLQMNNRDQAHDGVMPALTR